MQQPTILWLLFCHGVIKDPKGYRTLEGVTTAIVTNDIPMYIDLHLAFALSAPPRRPYRLTMHMFGPSGQITGDPFTIALDMNAHGVSEVTMPVMRLPIAGYGWHWGEIRIDGYGDDVLAKPAFLVIEQTKVASQSAETRH